MKPCKVTVHCGCKYTIKNGIAYYVCCKWHKDKPPLTLGGIPVLLRKER